MTASAHEGIVGPSNLRVSERPFIYMFNKCGLVSSSWSASVKSADLHPRDLEDKTIITHTITGDLAKKVKDSNENSHIFKRADLETQTFHGHSSSNTYSVLSG